MKGVPIRPATVSDVDGILKLQAANLQDVGGQLTARLPREWFLQGLGSMPILVAVEADQEVVGYLVTSPCAANRSIDVIRAMMSAIPLPDEAYIYGPICVAPEYRGQGVAAAMFVEICRLLPDRTAFTFIRADNLRSLAAHRGFGMVEVGSFVHGGQVNVILRSRVDRP